MADDFMLRGYLLPEGCNNLDDRYWKDLWRAMPSVCKPAPTAPPATFSNVIHGKMIVPEKMTVRELATALSKKDFQIIGALIKIAIFAKPTTLLDFDTIAKVLWQYGILARKVS